MKELQKRKLVQIILGFLLGRVNLFGMNPVGVAFFTAGYMEKGARLPVGISVLLGMATALPLEDVVIYGVAMLTVVLSVDLLEKQGITVRMGHAVFFLCIAIGLMYGGRWYLLPHEEYDLPWGLLEIGLSMVCIYVLREGIHFFLHARKGQSMGNEEMISLTLLGAFGVYGVPDVTIGSISVVLTAIQFFVLFMGYCYGTGAGAVAGTIGGCVLFLDNGNGSMLGILALMGILAGILRDQGKMIASVSYFLAASILCYLLDAQNTGLGELYSAAIAGGILLVIPTRFLTKIQVHAGGWEDYWESERLQGLMKYKLKDFSKSFQKLAEILQRGNQESISVQVEEIRQMMEVMSEQICGKCENAVNCGGQLSLFRPEMFQEMSVAREQGMLQEMQMPEGFQESCVCKEDFLAEVNQNIHFANIAMGYQNKIRYSQKVIAEQMQQVGSIVEMLSEKLPVIQKVPLEIREKLERELKRNRISIHEMAFYEKFDGRLEIHLKGRTRRGRFVTTREVAEVISSVLGCQMQIGEGYRKVFPGEDEIFVFEECAPLRAETGISRRARAGEEVSGDTFSCLDLRNGEMLLALSDGMGCGDAAYHESEQVIELIEQMSEAGFSEESAIKLINSMYMSNEGNHSFATADVAIVNLYKMECQFAKCGASTTFLYHNKNLSAIEGEALPIGVMDHMEPFMQKTSVSAGDYVIMMTDGVADCFSKEEDELQCFLAHQLEHYQSPQELSEQILEEGLQRLGGEPGDDMSVLVMKLYHAA